MASVVVDAGVQMYAYCIECCGTWPGSKQGKGLSKNYPYWYTIDGEWSQREYARKQAERAAKRHNERWHRASGS